MLQEKIFKFLQIYGVKFFIVLAFIILNYIITTIAEGHTHREWSTTGATVFYIVTMFLVLHVVTYKIDKIE